MRRCKVTIVGQDGAEHSAYVDAVSLFDAVEKAIPCWSPYWWHDPRAIAMTWNDVAALIGIVGGLCGFYSLYQNHQQTKLAKEQTDLMKDQAKKAAELDAEERQWAERHEKLATQLARINPGLMIADPNANSHLNLYPAVFPDPKFRNLIETYIVSLNPSRTEFFPRKPAPHELRMQGFRDTVLKCEELIEKFDKENPRIQLFYYLGVKSRV